MSSIVITGMGVAAPGGVTGPTSLWRMLEAGRDVLGPLPRDRGWPLDLLFSLGDRPGWAPVPDSGGFLDDAAEFDAAFFGVAPREAPALDPQQRVGLRVAWEALENAGLNPASLSGQWGGCFIGASYTEYGPRIDEVNELSGFRGTGVSLSAVSGRVSHALGLHGPSMTVDAACASSLAAISAAVASVASGESDWALAGGVCVMGSAAPFVEFSANGAISADGRCRPYSSRASGTVWSEGAALFVVEREDAARARGARILGRVRAAVVNHNGSGAPLAVPSHRAQEALCRRALAVSGLAAADITMIEGHGTATAVGDPIELRALHGTYGQPGPDGAPSASIGSIKANLGHAQAAAGGLGLAKVLLSGWHGRIPRSPHIGEPTRALDWEETRLRPAMASAEWPACDGRRCAVASSFGMAGTNAQLIIEMDERGGDSAPGDTEGASR
ncbi:polyketide synthase [Corynebacterium sp. HMSC11E11]|uniref:beta-ketoacyl [acyl carrier protein] synthase domain-containing protein n=1 Tax=Corynebacterium sp. HMSC11E11 TaxID=1581089 RepID=UPI0008A25102|nr:polyketide synthase [Corynebacterium sp. HMSC11E11]OFU55019.1 beta-ketoacyl synthase [Corynebacterium sp. HMSC11E11]